MTKNRKTLKKAGIEHAAIQTFTPQKEDQNSRFCLKKKVLCSR